MPDPGVVSHTVIVCAYSLGRLTLTQRCITAVMAQSPAPDQVIAVVDHNDGLLAALTERFPSIDVVPSTGPRGLSGARNTGIDRATGDIVAFIDDDAEPEPGWLAGLSAAFEDPRVVIAGGRATPVWARAQPRWFPDELLWIVGCSYRGQPASGDVRNPLGCNMAFRRTVFETAGTFDPGMGRIGTLPIGCEETELCVRAKERIPDGRIVLVDGAVVRHHVPAERASIRYALRRSFYEGVSKAALAALVRDDALSTERGYVVRTVGRGAVSRLARAVRLAQPLAALAQIGVLGLSVAAATIGYLYGRVRLRGRGIAHTARSIGSEPTGR